MAEKDSQSNSQNQHSERKFSQEQYELLKRCSENNDMTEWNEWREENYDKDIRLEGAELYRWYLKGALLNRHELIDAMGKLLLTVHGDSHLEGARFIDANL